MTETTISKLESGRAAHAFSAAKEGSTLTKAKEYKSYVKKMPMLIKTNGLGSALAFAFAKGAKGGVIQRDNAWGLLYNQIESWLKEDDKHLITFDDSKLLEKLLETESYEYRAVAVEVLAYLTWLRRFAEGLIEGEADNNE